MPDIPLTIFTPTYNRAGRLRRVFDSLCRQPGNLFEWLVVDDGSTDDTSAVLEELCGKASFAVRVIRQPNGGKHRAHNVAIRSARGELTIVLDSDDELMPGALENIWSEWNAIPMSERDQYAGIIGHCVDEANHLVGLPYPSERVDGFLFELTMNGVIVGEKLPCYRTDILRKFPFPERTGCTALVPEGTVWLQIGAKYCVRCIDKAIRVYHRDAGDSEALLNRYSRPETNPWGRMQYCLVVLNLTGKYRLRFVRHFAKAAAGYARYARHSGYSLAQQARPLKGAFAFVFWLCAVPVGTMAWMIDRIQGRRAKSPKFVFRFR
jgi:glycosyltransferase involved in cell wall biosynthesis